MNLRETIAQEIARFGLVGLLSNLCGFAIFILVTHLGVGYKWAMTGLYLFGGVVGYLGNKKWSFDTTTEHRSALWKYCFAYLMGYLINLYILIQLVDRMGYSHIYAQALAVIVVTTFLFLAFKFYVFAERE